MMKKDWLEIFEDSSDQTIMVIMEGIHIEVTDEGYLNIGEKSYQTSTHVLNRISNIIDKKKIIDRDKNIDKLL